MTYEENSVPGTHTIQRQSVTHKGHEPIGCLVCLYIFNLLPINILVVNVRVDDLNNSIRKG